MEGVRPKHCPHPLRTSVSDVKDTTQVLIKEGDDSAIESQTG